MDKLQQILFNYPDEDFGWLPSTIKADGEPEFMYGEAVIGVDFEEMRIIYSVQGVIDSLMEDGLEYEEALEHFDFNIRGYRSSEHKLPIWCEDLFLYDYEPNNRGKNTPDVSSNISKKS